MTDNVYNISLPQTLTNSTLQLGSSPQYSGIMNTLNLAQTLVFIKDHIEAVADSAAIDSLHQARARFGAYYFGSDESEDVTTLVGIYCQPVSQPGAMSPVQVGKVAVWGGGCDNMHCSSLMTDTVMLESAIKAFN